MSQSKKPPFDPAQYRELLKSFLAEDLGAADLTTAAIVRDDPMSSGHLVAKSPALLAGLPLFIEVFRILDPDLSATERHTDGDLLAPGDEPLRLQARARAMLAGERVALNLLQRMSGIATLTRKYVDAVAGTRARILDTRKTTPGLRALEKYAVIVGGGMNHRFGLYDAILIKENHIRLAGGVREALRAAQASRDGARFVEVEVSTPRELEDALKERPEVIMLDNFTPEAARAAVEVARARDGKVLLEASGAITLANVRQFAEAGVDWISAGALTHSAPAADLSFEIDPLTD